MRSIVQHRRWHSYANGPLTNASSIHPDNGVDLLRAVEIVYDGAPNPEVYATTAPLVDYQWIQAFRATVWRRG